MTNLMTRSTAECSAQPSSADILITMGCRDACPVYPGKRYLDWDLTDPAGKSIDEVPIVDEIDRRVRALLAELGIDSVALS